MNAKVNVILLGTNEKRWFWGNNMEMGFLPRIVGSSKKLLEM